MNVVFRIFGELCAYLEAFDDFANGSSSENFFHFLIDPSEEKAADGPLGSQFAEKELHE